jgi:hypothetical protein
MVKIIVLIFTLLALNAFALESTTSHDTASAIDTTVKPYTLELIDQGKFQTVLDLLEQKGIDPGPGKVVALGFENDKTTLVVINIDNLGNPVKTVYNLAPAFYEQVMTPLAREAEAPIEVKKPAPARRKQEGRLYFMTQTSLKSFLAYVPAYVTFFNDGNEGLIAGASLLTFGGAVYGSYKFTQNRTLGYGRVAMMNYGGELALTYGSLLKWLVRSHEDLERERVYEIDSTYNDMEKRFDVDTNYHYESKGSQANEYVKAVVNMVGFPAGIYLGSRVNLFDNYAYGNAATMRFFGRGAFVYGMLIPWLFYDGDEGLFETMFFEESDNQLDRQQRQYATAASLLSMGLIPAGNYLGYRLVKDKNISSGRSFFIETAGVMGMVSGFLLPTLGEAEEKNIYLASGMAGGVLGTFLGFKYKKEQNYRFAQGAFMALSAAGGAAVALALPLIGETDDHQVYTICGLAGGWGGLLLGEKLSHKIFEKSSKDSRQAVKIDLPVMWQWPVLLAASNKKITGKSQVQLPKVELIRVSF